MKAGAAIQLDARREVLKELVNESTAPRTTAAGTPRKIAPRKMKQSPAVTLAFVPGMLTGSMPPMTTRLASTSSSAHCGPPNARKRHTPHAKTSAPPDTAPHAPREDERARRHARKPVGPRAAVIVRHVYANHSRPPAKDKVMSAECRVMNGRPLAFNSSLCTLPSALLLNTLRRRE